MKYIFPLLAVWLLASGCNRNDEDVKFEMVYQRDFSIPAGLNPFETHYFYLEDISIGSYLDNNNVIASELVSINPGVARMSNLFSGLGDYDFIRDVSIRIYTDDENVWKEVFFRDQVPLNTGEDLDIIPTLVDAKQFFEYSKFNLIVRMQFRAAPQQTMETRLNFSFLAK